MPDVEANFHKYCSATSPTNASFSSSPSSSYAVIDGNCGNVMAFGKFFIPSLIHFNLLTRLSFKSFCMSVTDLKSFKSSYCVFKSPTRSDRKFCWILCIVLGNSLTIKSLFEYVIFRNDVSLLAIFYFILFYRTWF